MMMNESSSKMDLLLARVVRILNDDWSIKLGENGSDRALKHLATMFRECNKSNPFEAANVRVIKQSKYRIICLMSNFCMSKLPRY